MSVHRLTRGQRLMGKIGAAAVLATLSGAPAELTHWVVGDQDASSMALAGRPPGGGGGGGGGSTPTTPLPESLANPWFADWTENTAATAPANFFATPTNTLGLPFMQTQLHGSAAAGRPLGVKIETSLSFADGASLFNTKYQPGDRAISYVFGDIEQGTRDEVKARVTALVGQARLSQWSKNAYVGQWDLTPLNPGDEKFGRTPPGPPPGDLIGSQHRGWGKPDYDAMRVNMANTSLYPGGASFRNASSGDWANDNIRVGLFVAPIGRATQVQQILDKSYNGRTLATGLKNHKQIPWIARFNNVGNASLDNDNLPNASFVFRPGTPLPSAPHLNTSGQMLGRGDVGAMVKHLQMRGVYSVNAFESGVVDYSQKDFQDDIRAAWTGDARLNNIMAQADAKYATMSLSPFVDGMASDTRLEETGTIWSGQFSLQAPNPNSTAGKGNNSGGKGDMVILASNMDAAEHLIKFGSGDTPYDIYLEKTAQGYTWEDDNQEGSRVALIEAGMHKIFNFDLVETRVYSNEGAVGSDSRKNYSIKTVWLLNNSYDAFTNNEGRNDVGIPEPTTFGSLAAAGALAVVCRRQRRKA